MERRPTVFELPVAPPFSPPSVLGRRRSYEAPGSRRGGCGDLPGEEAAAQQPRHFLDACRLCRRPLGRSCDVFMYRGDMPFCSEDCRQEQIDLDLAREEEEAGYRRSRRRMRNPRSTPRRVNGPAEMAADLPTTIPAAAGEAAVAG